MNLEFFDRAPLTSENDRRRMLHFHALGFTEQAGAIRRLAATGMTHDGISRATGLAVEQLRRVLADSRRETA